MQPVSIPPALLLLLSCLCARLALSAVVVVPNKEAVEEDDASFAVPAGLLYGAGVSAFQAEGAWQEGGKAESALEHVVHTPGNKYTANADTSADHYHRYKEDLALAKEMKLNTHRFSISWSRVLPEGGADKPNPEGVKFYHDYIDEIKKNDMEPMVTMYHFDHPLSLEKETGGWTNSNMVQKFVEYADFIFAEYGSKVRFWNPVNEGNMYCIFMLPQLTFAGLNPVDNTTYYRCLHNTVLAHARTYRLYKNKYFAEQKGQVGTSVLIWPGTAASDRYEDAVAAQQFNDLFAGSLVHPAVFGEYPEVTRYLVGARDAELGLAEPRLPRFTEEEKEDLFSQGPATDFVALNVYSGFKVAYTTDPADVGTRPAILQPPVFDLPNVKFTSGGGFDKLDPFLMKNALLWAWNNYHLPLVITENGFGDTVGAGVRDTQRAAYLSAALRGLVQAVNEYHIPVISYYAWSLLDVYEFSAGYDQRPFGLIHVDYADGTLRRTIKDSARRVFTAMAETGRVPYVAPESPSTTTPRAATTTPSSSSPSSTPSSSSSSSSTHSVVTSTAVLAAVLPSLLALLLQIMSR